MKRILFVCTGNICRSPWAEGFFRALVRDRRDIEVASAGVSAGFGQAPSSDGVKVLRDEEGIDISRQRSQPVTEALIEKTDLIFAMTRDHLNLLELLFP